MAIDTAYFKKKLEEELALLETQLKTVARKNPSNPADWELTGAEMDVTTADPFDEATSYETEEENAGILNALEIRYNEVKDALARVEAGTYGICKVGGQEITRERLEANPAATTCTVHMNKDAS